MAPLHFLFGVILPFLTSIYSANMTISQRNLQACVLATADSDNADFVCSLLQLNRECLNNNFQESFTEDYVEIVVGNSWYLKKINCKTAPPESSRNRPVGS